MLSIQQKMMAILLLTGTATSLVWAETFEHGPVSMPPPAASTPVPSPQPVAATPAAVSRSAFTTAISGREPVDKLDRISAGQQVYYFTELVGLQGHVITHKWERNGSFQLGLQFPVGGSPWRVNSSKSISPALPGTWTVTVQNDDGSILGQESLVVDPVIPAPAQPLTTIPPDIQKNPVPRPAIPPSTGSEPVPAIPEQMPTPEPAQEQPTNARPIWETMPR